MFQLLLVAVVEPLLVRIGRVACHDDHRIAGHGLFGGQTSAVVVSDHAALHLVHPLLVGQLGQASEHVELPAASVKGGRVEAEPGGELDVPSRARPGRRGGLRPDRFHAHAELLVWIRRVAAPHVQPAASTSGIRCIKAHPLLALDLPSVAVIKPPLVGTARTASGHVHLAIVDIRLGRVETGHAVGALDLAGHVIKKPQLLAIALHAAQHNGGACRPIRLHPGDAASPPVLDGADPCTLR